MIRGPLNHPSHYKGYIMFVVCPCGKKLKVADKLAGKKVRCPGCETVFIAEEDDDDEGNVAPPKNRVKRPSDEEMSSKQRLVASIKRKGKPPSEDESDFDDDEEQPGSSRNKSRPVSGNNPTLALWRNIIGSSVLGILLIALGVITWRTYNQPGLLALDINVGDSEVFVDGKKMELSKEDRLGSVNLPPFPRELTRSRSLRLVFKPTSNKSPLRLAVPSGSKSCCPPGPKSKPKKAIRKGTASRQRGDLVLLAVSLTGGQGKRAPSARSTRP
jgi:hypothetical protein